MPARQGRSYTVVVSTSRKPFDSVPRQCLWEVLASLSVQGDILSCLKSVYERDEACVLTQAGLTEAFRCNAGVKQGCPASPLLFGLYIHELEARLKANSIEVATSTSLMDLC